MADHGELEIEILRVTDEARPVDPPSGPHRPRRWIPLALVAVFLAGFAIGTSSDDGTDETGQPTPPVASEADPLGSLLPSPTTSGSAEQAVAEPGRTFPAVLVLPGADDVQTPFALTARASVDRLTSPLWVIESGRALSRAGLTLRRGNDRYPLLFAGDGLAYMGPNDAQRMTADALSVEPLLLLNEPVDYIVAGASADRLWAVQDAGSPLRATLVDGGTPGATFDVDGLRWIRGGVADGVIGFESGLSSTAGPVAYWTPAAGSRPVTAITDDHAAILATGGDLVVVFETGPGIAVVDVRTDTRLAERPIGNHPTHACFSPGGTYLALTQGPPDGKVLLFDALTLSLAGTFIATPVHDIAWTTDEQLLISVDDVLVLIDVPEMNETPIVQLSGADGWWIATNAAAC